MDRTDLVRLVALIGVAILIIPGVVIGLRDRRKAVRNAAIWAVLFVLVLAAVWLLRQSQ